MSTATRDPEFDTSGDTKKKSGTGRLRCLVVTPESTILDEPADSVVLPLFDGQLGVLPGRAPLLGRIGSGELTIREAGGTRSLFLDGGFVQVRDDVVNVLTLRAMTIDSIDATAAQSELESARTLPGRTEFDIKERDRALERARAKVRLSGRPRSAH